MSYNKRQNVELVGIYTENVIKTIIAFANTMGGKIYIGIDDDGSVTGIKNTDYILSQIKKTIENTVKPNIISFIVFTVKVINEKNVILIEVQKGVSRPYFIISESITPGGIYIREGYSTVPASLKVILKMLEETGEGNFEDTISINQNLTFNYMIKEFKEIDADKMKSLGIINNDGLYTNLGLLLSDQCSYTTKLAIFRSTKNKDSKSQNRYEFKSSILEQFDLTYSLLDSYNEAADEFNSLKSKENRAYPPSALKEALLNAICHRDYSIKSSTLISVFSDRIEIINAGGLADGICENDIKAGLSVPRNEKLSKILYRLKLIEACGTGISKIEKNYAESSVKPEICVTENTFKIILPGVCRSKQALTISENETRVIEFAENTSPFTRQEICDNLNLTKSTAVSILKKLSDKGLIFKEGNGKNTVYYLKNKVSFGGAASKPPPSF